jgi:hypothetical protein
VDVAHHRAWCRDRLHVGLFAENLLGLLTQNSHFIFRQRFHFSGFFPTLWQELRKLTIQQSLHRCKHAASVSLFSPLAVLPASTALRCLVEGGKRIASVNCVQRLRSAVFLFSSHMQSDRRCGASGQELMHTRPSLYHTKELACEGEDVLGESNHTLI